MASPFPALKIQMGTKPQLTFPWAIFTGHNTTEDGSFGDGGGMDAAMTIIIFWSDLKTAVQQIIGYSKVSKKFDANGTLIPFLERNLPLEHPQFQGMYCTKITRFEGLNMEGKEIAFAGPTTKYEFAKLTLKFTKPSYILLPDSNITSGAHGAPVVGTTCYWNEWDRYLDRSWKFSIQLITRPGQSVNFVQGLPGFPIPGGQFQGSFGVRVGRMKYTRTWYQLPEEALFGRNLGDNSPAQIPYALLYGTTNGVRYTQRAANAVRPNAFGLTGSNLFMPGTVNISDFLSCTRGCLLYEGFELIQRPLPLPAELMGFLQSFYPVQFDVRFNVEFYDPPLGPIGTQPFPGRERGHNCMPYQDGLFYFVAPAPFSYTEFRDLFQVRSIT